MGSGAPFLLLLAFVAVVSAALWWGWARAKQRRELLQGFAAGQGWHWAPRDDSWCLRFAGSPFGQGDHRKALNVLQGQFRGRPVVAFDYSYETHGSDSDGTSSTTTHHYAICAVSMPAPLPELSLTPEGVLGRVGTMLGRQDIELESEDFNRRFRVQCEDARLAYDLLPPRTMQALLTRPALHVRLRDADALCWESGTHSPSELLSRLDTLSTLLDGVPPYVWSDRRGTAPWPLSTPSSASPSCWRWPSSPATTASSGSATSCRSPGARWTWS